MKQAQHKRISFHDFTLDLNRGCLFRGAEEIKLRPKSFDVLRHLVENYGRLVRKEELLEAVWPDTAVTDDSLVQCLIDVRRALGNGSQQIVKTVPRRGYIFDAEVIKHDSGEKLTVYAEEVEGVVVAIEKGELESTANAVTPNSLPSSGLLRSGRAVYLGLSCAALIVMAGVLILYSHRATTGHDQVGPIRSLAVLPLENLSGDPAQEYFADGMTEELISKLAQIRALKVISRTSVAGYKGIHRSLPQIARELNVDAVIEGTVQRSGGRVRVTAKLIHAATDAHLWARDYDRDLTDVLKLQSDIAREVADEIRIQVTPDERTRLASAGSVNPQANEMYLLGRYHLNKGNEQGWKLAVDYFERAIALAPDYGAAYAGLSDAWLQRGIFGWNFKDVESPARVAALKAIELDEQIAEAHVSLSNIKYAYDWDWAGAERESRRALELDPGSLQAHLNYGHLLMALGRHQDAIREGQSAAQLDPLSAVSQSALGRFLYRAHRYEEAIPHLQRAVELEPQNEGANFRLGDAYTETGRYDEAIASFKTGAIAAFGEVAGKSVGIARVYALMGKPREARQMLTGLKSPAISMAAVYTALDDKDEAFRILEKAVQERGSYLVYIKADPPLEKLHSDPRWKMLLRRMNFPPG